MELLVRRSNLRMAALSVSSVQKTSNGSWWGSRDSVVGTLIKLQPAKRTPPNISQSKNSNTQRTENKTTDVVIHQHSRRFLKMDILMSETWWAYNKWNKIASDIKLVFHSSTKLRGSTAASGKGFFSSPKRADGQWSPPSFPFSGYRVYLPGIKRRGREIRQSTLFIAEFKNMWMCTSTPPVNTFRALMHCLLIRIVANFTFRYQLAVCVYLPLVSLFRTWRRARREIHAGLGLEKRKERDSLQDLGANGRIFLKWIFADVGWEFLDWIG